MSRLLVIGLLMQSFALLANVNVSSRSDVFNKNFKLQRNSEGKLISVEMRWFKEEFKLQSVFSNLIQNLNNLRAVNKNGEFQFEQDLRALEWELEQLTDHSLAKNEMDLTIDENIGVVRRSLYELVDRPAGEIETLTRDEFFNIYQKEFKEILSLFSLTVLARPNEKRYFFVRKGLEEFVERMLKLAEDKFSHLPWLNFVSSMVVRIHDYLWEMRNYNQFMLLHFLETGNEAELGLTREEADFIISSIYESRIGLGDILSSNMAVKDWANYGINSFYTELRGYNTRLRRSSMATMEQERVNFAFLRVNNGDHFRIYNLRDNAHRFSRQFSLAFDSEKPMKVARERTLMALAEVGLSFITLPGWIKTQVTSFIQSMHKNQSITEGAMHAYLQLNPGKDYEEYFKRSQLNPFLK